MIEFTVSSIRHSMASDAPVDAALVDELDALRAVYGGDDAFDADLFDDPARVSTPSTLSCARTKDALGRGIVRVVFDATPRASTVVDDGDEDAETYVAITFVVDVRDDGAYPTEATPTFRFVDARGFEPDDARALSRDVDASMREHAGEHCLLVMTECVSERVRALNRPRGRCAICCEDFGRDDDCRRSAPTTKLETCWHAFHARCFTRWRERRAKDFEAIRAEAPNFSEGSEEEARLREKTTHRCPTCRAPTTEDDARRCERALARIRRRETSTDDDDDDDESCAATAANPLDSLDEETRAALESMRASFASAMSAQRRRGGVVDERRDGVGVVIDETTTFRRAEPSTVASNERATPPAATTATKKPSGGKNASWLRRAAARKSRDGDAASVPEPKTSTRAPKST